MTSELARGCRDCRCWRSLVIVRGLAAVFAVVNDGEQGVELVDVGKGSMLGASSVFIQARLMPSFRARPSLPVLGLPSAACEPVSG